MPRSSNSCRSSEKRTLKRLHRGRARAILNQAPGTPSQVTGKGNLPPTQREQAGEKNKRKRVENTGAGANALAKLVALWGRPISSLLPARILSCRFL
jgi:hypothetical protein